MLIVITINTIIVRKVYKMPFRDTRELTSFTNPRILFFKFAEKQWQ